MIKRNKIILIVLLSVAVLACGAVAWQMIKAAGEKSEAEEQRNRDFNSLKQIYNSEVFPSPENIQRVKDDQKQLEEWLESISSQLHKGDLSESNHTPATFKRELQQTVRELSEQPGIKNGKIVAANFHFGFEQYLGESNQLPKSDDVPRLARQLGMIEKISKELFDAKILSLDSISREKFDDAETAAADTSRRQPSRRRRRPVSSNKDESVQEESLADRVVEIPEGLVSKEEFTFEFIATPEAFISALNKLTAMDLFVVVSETGFNKTGDQLKKVDEITQEKKPDGVAARKLSEMNHYERTVTDPVSDPPVSVKLVLEVYSFKGV
ncbi:MAG: Amuc_1100 family pilus-like protein [Kiritimatiellia bacterium]